MGKIEITIVVPSVGAKSTFEGAGNFNSNIIFNCARVRKSD